LVRTIIYKTYMLAGKVKLWMKVLNTIVFLSLEVWAGSIILQCLFNIQE
jgi:hypothetical protein